MKYYEVRYGAPDNMSSCGHRHSSPVEALGDCVAAEAWAYYNNASPVIECWEVEDDARRLITVEEVHKIKEAEIEHLQQTYVAHLARYVDDLSISDGQIEGRYRGWYFLLHDYSGNDVLPFAIGQPELLVWGDGDTEALDPEYVDTPQEAREFLRRAVPTKDKINWKSEGF